MTLELMRKSSLRLALIISIAAGFIACAKPEISNSSNSAANQNANSAASNANVASSMKLVAYHFEKKLELYEGTLKSLNTEGGNVNAEWDSKKCDSFRSEVIDLAICINRGYNDAIKTINVRRTCDSNTRNFSISGEKYNQYKTGKIGDPQFTEGIE